MDRQPTILLAAKTGWVAAMFHEVLASHGYKVLIGQCGFTPLVLGHAFRGKIDLLLAESDYKGEGSGKALAGNLRVNRRSMPCLFFVVRDGEIRMGTDPESPFTMGFSPAFFLKEVHDDTARRQRRSTLLIARARPLKPKARSLPRWTGL